MSSQFFLKRLFSLLLFFLFVLLGASPNALSAEEIHYSVQFKGVPQKFLNDLKKQEPTINFQKATPEDVDKILKNLFKTNHFESLNAIAVDPEAPTEISITGTPLKRVGLVEITGNHPFGRAEVLEFIETAPGNPFEHQKIRDGAEKIKNDLGEKGFFNSIVEAEFKIQKDTNIDVLLKIEAGKQCEISKVEFSTDNDEIKKLAQSTTKSSLKKPLTEENLSILQKDFTSLLRDNRFLTTKVLGPEVKYNAEKTESTLIYSFEEAHRYVLLFEGNSHFSSSELIKELNLNRSNEWSSQVAGELNSKLVDIYRRTGFAYVSVDHIEKQFDSGLVRQVQFRISEGPRVKIRELLFEGTMSRPSKYYKSFIEDNSSPIVSDGYYNREDIEFGLKNLITELQNQGYLRAKILSTRAEYALNKKVIDVTVQIEEGPLTTVKAIKFKGAQGLTEDELLKSISLTEGAPLKLNSLESSLEALKEKYRSNGFIDVAILNEKDGLVEYNSDYTQATLRFEIKEGPQVVVASIVVEGNYLTKEEVILTELDFKVGDRLTPEKIFDSQYRLQRLGLFGAVDISMLESGTPVADRTVIVKVSERDPGLFNTGFGGTYESNNTTIRSYLGLSYRNLNGTARAISGRVEVNRITDIDFLDHKITSGYLEPYLFHTRTRGRVNLTRAYNIVDRIKETNILARESNQLELTLERDISRSLKFVWNLWSIAYVREFEVLVSKTRSSLNIASVGPTLEYDKRDNPVFPRRGYFSRVNIEYSNPDLGSSKEVHYIRGNAGFNFYLPLGRLVFANSLRGGYLANLTNLGSVPDVKRFYLGGRSSLRGFDVRALPPSRAPLIDTGVESAVAVNSDSHFYLIQSELRIPLYGDFETVVFYDGGAVKVSGFRFEDEYRDAVGLGFRYNTPVGPVSAEYGFKLDRNNKLGESEGRFHFSIGSF